MLDRARALADAGKTVIMILHDFESILHCADHVILMTQGKVLFSGDAEAVLRSDQIKEAFNVQPSFVQTDNGLHCFVRPIHA